MYVGTQFDFSNQISMKAIFSMEKECNSCVPLLSELAKKQSEFQEEIQVSGKSGIVSSIAQWLKSSGSDIKKEPTWQNLFHILRCINLSPLAWQMVDCILRAMIGRYTSATYMCISNHSAITYNNIIIIQMLQRYSKMIWSVIVVQYFKRRMSWDKKLNLLSTTALSQFLFWKISMMILELILMSYWRILLGLILWQLNPQVCKKILT